MKIAACILAIFALFGVSSVDALTLDWGQNELGKLSTGTFYSGIQISVFQDVTLDKLTYRSLGYADTVWLFDSGFSVLDVVSVPALANRVDWPPSSTVMNVGWELKAGSTYNIIAEGYYMEPAVGGSLLRYNLGYDEYRGYGIYNTSFEGHLDYAENEHLRVVAGIQYNTYHPERGSYLMPQFWFGFDHLVTSVPEPISLLLLGLGLFGLLGFRRVTK